MDNDKISCYNCKHFYVTWDKNFPKGCKMYGFKSQKLPSTAVREATGVRCAGFEQKTQVQSND